MSTSARVVAGVLGIALVGLAVWQLRDTTMSTHVPVPDDSQLAVIIDAETKLSETGQSVHELATGKVLMCRLEVRSSDPVGGLEPVGDDRGRFRFVLQPTLDDADRTQFRGCLEDWNVDHILIDVVEMHDVDS